MTMKIKPPRPRTPSSGVVCGPLWTVQLLRGLAAMMVVIGHSQSAIGHLALVEDRAFTRWNGLPWGASVDLFFVISGFIIVYASQSLFGTQGARTTFLRRRITRIVPLYWFCSTLYLAILALAAIKGGDSLPDPLYIAASYLFVPTWASDGMIFPLFDLGWTLNYEMGFYLLLALLIGFDRKPALAGVLLMLAGAVALGAVFRFGAAPLLFWTRPIMIDFGLGVIVGGLVCGRASLPPALRVALVFLGGLIFCTDPIHVFTVPLGATVANGWPRVLLAGIPAALVMAGLLLGPQKPMPSLARPAVAIGDASYSLYLTHPFVLILTEKLVQKTVFFRELPLPLLVIFAVVTAVALSQLSFHWIEKPLSSIAGRCWAWLASGMGRRAPPASPAAPAGAGSAPRL